MSVEDLGPVTLLPVVCPRCSVQVGQVEARTATSFFMTADGRKDGHVTLDIKIRRHVTDEEKRRREEEARRSPRAGVAATRDWQYATSSESFDHVCATITRP